MESQGLLHVPSLRKSSKDESNLSILSRNTSNSHKSSKDETSLRKLSKDFYQPPSDLSLEEIKNEKLEKNQTESNRKRVHDSDSLENKASKSVDDVARRKKKPRIRRDHRYLSKQAMKPCIDAVTAVQENLRLYGSCEFC